MKFARVRNRFHIDLLILLVLVFGSVVWAGDVGTRLRCTVTDQAKAFVGQAQLTLKSSNNAFSMTGVGSQQGEHTFVTTHGRDVGVKMRESK
jgi:hypothetical protein